MTNCSHWGLCTPTDESGCYTLTAPQACAPSVVPGVILTGEGDVLLRRDASSTHPASCTVAIIVGKDHGTLTPSQTAQLLRLWDVAVKMAAGRPEAITLLPVSQQWRFPEEAYVPLESWRG